MPLQIYNTLTRRKDQFKPLNEGRVGMYVCGPTVYGHSHIGHAKSYVSFDVIVRYLRYLGYKVRYVQNITDVGHLLGDTNEGEDRILKQSAIEQKHPMEVAESYTRSYFEDMDMLGIIRADIFPRATGHITEQIELIMKLIEKGYAYEVNGSVYFDLSRDSEYGKLSGRSTEEVESGTRVEVRTEKRHQNDFALWKKAEPEHIMRWNSPWGVGFPGWHVECSAMSIKYLGETFDIHGGGMDNQFPHHECEIAQSECATGKPFVRYWIHNNLVTVNTQKMSKSLGNVILLKDVFKKYHPLVIRFFILQSHYRSTLDFTDEALSGAAKGWEKLMNTMRNVKEAMKGSETKTNRDSGFKIQVSSFKEKFIDAMNDDFNTPQAIAVLFDLIREVNSAISEGKINTALLQEIDIIYTELCGGILGLIPSPDDKKVYDDKDIEEELLRLIVDLRTDARAQKLWSFSDTIRDRLEKVGIVLKDKKEGTIWRRG
ncbi:MAG TPA: cysteine--tRNA ligase [Bacteroidota bacterium]|nr:cysteine--tRNA ligase [Bacteroidota bacterium]